MKCVMQYKLYSSYQQWLPAPPRELESFENFIRKQNDSLININDRYMGAGGYQTYLSELEVRNDCQ
jgi:hypothetical protein